MSVHMRRWRESYEGERLGEQLGAARAPVHGARAGSSPATFRATSCFLGCNITPAAVTTASGAMPGPAPSRNWRNASVPGLQIRAVGWGTPRKAGVLGWPPKTCFRPSADISKPPSLTIYSFCF